MNYSAFNTYVQETRIVIHNMHACTIEFHSFLIKTSIVYYLKFNILEQHSIINAVWCFLRGTDYFVYNLNWWPSDSEDSSAQFFVLCCYSTYANFVSCDSPKVRIVMLFNSGSSLYFFNNSGKYFENNCGNLRVHNMSI